MYFQKNPDFPLYFTSSTSRCQETDLPSSTPEGNHALCNDKKISGMGTVTSITKIRTWWNAWIHLLLHKLSWVILCLPCSIRKWPLVTNYSNNAIRKGFNGITFFIDLPCMLIHLSQIYFWILCSAHKC